MVAHTVVGVQRCNFPSIMYYPSWWQRQRELMGWLRVQPARLARRLADSLVVFWIFCWRSYIYVYHSPAQIPFTFRPNKLYTFFQLCCETSDWWWLFFFLFSLDTVPINHVCSRSPIRKCKQVVLQHVKKCHMPSVFMLKGHLFSSHHLFLIRVVHLSHWEHYSQLRFGKFPPV